MRKALVLGGYGLIGLAAMRALRAAGFEVTGVGRSARAARMAAPDLRWVIHDIGTVTTDEWRALLQGVSVVVNAAGALQDGARDDLEAIHVTALRRLTEAARGLRLRIVQVSAAGVSETASTEFFRSKARGDAVLMAGGGDWVILRPVLVLAPEAYGGTALLRAAAALPGTLPVLLPGSSVQTVHIDDLAAAIVAAATGRMPSGTIAEITEAETRHFPELLAAARRWMGLPDARWRPRIPGWLIRLASGIADLLGHLGWRSPMRSTALTALGDGIRGDPRPWEALGGSPCRPLAASLAALPATRQERLHARVFLALPLAIAVLALFWCATGIVTLADLPAATSVLTARGTAAGPATGIAAAGATADILLGLGLLWRPWTRAAALGMAALSVAYLAGSLVLAPGLWLDPLGPMLKVLPGTVLALFVWLMVEER